MLVQVTLRLCFSTVRVTLSEIAVIVITPEKRSIVPIPLRSIYQKISLNLLA